MIAAYSPQARGRSERMFRTHQERLSKELALAGIIDMEAANQYLKEVYMPAFNAEFMQPAAKPEDPTLFGVPLVDLSLLVMTFPLRVQFAKGMLLNTGFFGHKFLPLLFWL